MASVEGLHADGDYTCSNLDTVHAHLAGAAEQSGNAAGQIGEINERLNELTQLVGALGESLTGIGGVVAEAQSVAYETQQYFETTTEGSNSYDIEEVKGELSYVSSSTESVQDRTQEVAGYVEELLASLALAWRAMDGVSGNFARI